MVRYSSDSGDVSPRLDNRHQRSSRDHKLYNKNSSHSHRERSHSPDGEHGRTRRRYSSESDSPPRRRRDSRDHPRQSRHEHSRSRSPPPKRRRHDEPERRSTHHRNNKGPSSRQQNRRFPSPPHPKTTTKRSTTPLPSQKAAFSKDASSDLATSNKPSSSLPEKEKEKEKQKPNYAPSGLLAAETNTVANTTIVLKYNEPPEARLPPPSAPWRLYIFKGSEALETLNLFERSCWLFGREQAVVDHATEHPSCSKQHAVLQFRYTEKKEKKGGEWGERKGRVRLYVIDLESANGTQVNGEMVPERRYVEVKSGDVIRFGESTREYVVLLPPKE
ncbi:MAG: hypothetical protein Q9164_004499 [Protoblastenia rupestris]